MNGEEEILISDHITVNYEWAHFGYMVGLGLFLASNGTAYEWILARVGIT